MTLEQIYTMLSSTGYPVAYHHFEKSTGKAAEEIPAEEQTPPPPPFIVYLVPNNNDISADGIVAIKVPHIRVELYTCTKDQEAEGKVEQALKNNHIFYEKTEAAIESENIYQAAYEFDMEG